MILQRYPRRSARPLLLLLLLITVHYSALPPSVYVSSAYAWSIPFVVPHHRHRSSILEQQQQPSNDAVMTISRTRCCDLLPLSNKWQLRLSSIDSSSSSSTGRIDGTSVENDVVVDLENVLQEMDVVIYSHITDGRRQLGAVQEDGRITPLCVWTMEPAYRTCMEFLVAQEDFPGYTIDALTIEALVPQTSLSYGSRQVGGGMGPENPHGERSELLYYIEQSILDDYDIEIRLRPDLEVFW